MSEVSETSRYASCEIRMMLAREQRSGRWLAEQIGKSNNYTAVRLREEGEWTLGDIESAAKALDLSFISLIPR